MAKKRVGIIVTPPGRFIDIHEKRTADYIAVVLGWDVAFLVPNRTQGTKTPDIRAHNLDWEMKVPIGKSARTIENILRRALAQSPYIILDLRRMDGRIPTAILLRRVEQRFIRETSARHIIVITRQETHIDFIR